MKVNIVMIMIALAMASLLAYMIYTIIGEQDMRLLPTIGSFLCFASTLVPLCGMNFEPKRNNVNVKVLSAIAFFMILVVQLIFSICTINHSAYIIVNGILLLLFLLIAYRLVKLKQV